MVKRLSARLSDKEISFVNWYAKRDGISFIEELERMLYVAIQDEMMIYGGDFTYETGISLYEEG